jgi:hypothetical protein
MVVSVPRYRLWGLGALAVTLALLGINGEGQSQPPKGGDEPEEKILGASACIVCHEKPNPVYEREKRTDFVRLDESTIWQTKDLHGKAFDALKQPLGQQMSKVLKYDVTTAPQCLSCHSVDLEPAKKPGDKNAKDYYTDFGVSCEGCHGFAHKWNTPHVSKTWRDREPAYKEARGQWDMRNPARRAERCISCHVGSESEGRFVTHEMYAAGHPPLPPVEVMAFSRDEPMHYKLARDLPDLVRIASADPDKSWKLFHFRGADVESQVARQTAIGAIMSLRAAAKLIADRAGAIDPSKEALDLAHFDCYACHHDLQSPSWRQARGYVGVPGRPQIRPGLALPAKVVAEHAANALNADASSPLRTFGDNFKYVTDTFDARPFGEPAKVAEAAKALVAWCDDALKQLDNVRYNREQTAKLLKAFVDAGQAPPEGKTNPWLDADAAQQLVWTLESLRGELEGPDGPIAQTLDTLKSKLPREVRDTSKMDFLATTLGGRLKREYEFTPDEFHAAFGKLAGMVK